MKTPHNRNSALTRVLLTAGLSLSLCSVSTAATLIFDFGPTNQETEDANNFSTDAQITQGTFLTINNPVTTTGETLDGVTVTFTGTQGPNTSGPTAPTGTYGAIFVGDTTRDSIYGNGTSFIPTLVFTGLDPSVAYTFDFGGTRGGVLDIRTSQYNVTGLNSGFAILDTSNNTSETVSVMNILPTAEGTLTVTVTKPETNTGTYVYLGGMRMTSVAVPEPSGAVLFGLSGLGLFLRRRRA